MHKDKRAEKITGTDGKDKAAVMGIPILERGPRNVGSKIRVKIVDNTKTKTLQSEIRDRVFAWRYDGVELKTPAETITDLSPRCAGPDQFRNFDRAFRTALTAPKAALLKEDARWQRAKKVN